MLSISAVLIVISTHFISGINEIFPIQNPPLSSRKIKRRIDRILSKLPEPMDSITIIFKTNKEKLYEGIFLYELNMITQLCHELGIDRLSYFRLTDNKWLLYPRLRDLNILWNAFNDSNFGDDFELIKRRRKLIFALRENKVLNYYVNCIKHLPFFLSEKQVGYGFEHNKANCIEDYQILVKFVTNRFNSEEPITKDMIKYYLSEITDSSKTINIFNLRFHGHTINYPKSSFYVSTDKLGTELTFSFKYLTKNSKTEIWQKELPLSYQDAMLWKYSQIYKKYGKFEEFWSVQIPQ